MSFMNGMRILAVACLAVFTGQAVAQHQWNGAGGNDLWSTGANWTNGTAPANPYTGTIVFTAEDTGNTNEMDQDRVVRYLNYQNCPVDKAPLTTDLAGRTLTISNGYLAAGYYYGLLTNHTGQASGGSWFSNTVVNVTNGVVELGVPGAPADLYAGYVGSGYIQLSGIVFRIAADLNAVNLKNLYVAYQLSSWSTYRVNHSLLDLSAAVIQSRGEQGALILSGDLKVGNGQPNYGGGRGTLLLPEALEKMEARSIVIGGEGCGYDIVGKVDFGPDSRLRVLTATNAFRLGGNGSGELVNFPTGVTFTVGLSNAPGSLRVGAGVPYTEAGTRSILVLTNGTLIAWLQDLQVGSAFGYNYSRTATSHLDLASSAVQIGGSPNSIKVPVLTIAGYRRDYTYNSAVMHGRLSLPGSVTNMEVGLLEIGANYQGVGVLDFGANSQLKRLAVTNDFILSQDGGYGSVKGLPTNG